jgi:hypothetical protein
LWWKGEVWGFFLVEKCEGMGGEGGWFERRGFVGDFYFYFFTAPVVFSGRPFAFVLVWKESN